MALVSELVSSPIQGFNAILIKRTVWFGKIINYFQPQSEVDIHSIIYRIQDLIEKNFSVLKQPTFIKDVLQLTNKLDAHVCTLFENNPNLENKKLLFFIFSLERCILTRISSDQTKNLEVMQSIKRRLIPENVISYLVSANFRQNISLASTCCSYMEDNRIVEIKNLKEYLIEKPEKTISLLNAGCLAKSDLIIKAVWEIICLDNNFDIFKTDKQTTPSLDYLINKQEFSNQTLLVGNLQNPQPILVSREILVQKNEYFKGLFRADFSEGSQSSVILKDQELQNVDYEGFLYFLRYIYAGKIDVPLDLCRIISHLADIYLEPDLKKICDKKKWNQAVLALKDKGLIGKFQSTDYEKFFYLVHETYTGKTDVSSVIRLKDLDAEKFQGIDYKEILYLLHYVYTLDEDVPLDLCSNVSYLADIYLEPDLKKAADQKMLQ